MSKLTNCKACNKEIAKGVNKCPHCGKDQRNFFMKHKIITGILVLIVLGAIGSANNKPTKVGESKAVSGSVASTDKSSSSSSTDKTPEPTTFKIGDVVALGDLNLTVTKAEKSSGAKYETPKEGSEYVIVSVKIQNKGKKVISYNPLYFKLQNSKGQATSETFSTVNKDTALSSGDLASGGEIEGSIVFEEPKGDPQLSLQYQDNILNKDKKVSINLQ